MPKFLDELRLKKNYFDWDEHKEFEGEILAIIKWMNPNYFNGKDGEQKSIKVPKFKVGDFIQFNGMGHTRYTVKEVCGLSHYINTCNKRMDMSYTDANFELVEQKPAVKLELDENDEPVLTSFESELFSMMSDVWQDYMLGHKINIAKTVKEHSAELLKIANRKSLTEWSDHDEDMLNSVKLHLDNAQVGKEFYFWLDNLKNRVQPQPKQEWSEEDKKLIDDTCHLINTLASGYGEKVTEPITLSGTQMIASIKDRLRALVDNRPQNTWKPSEEQIVALKHASNDCSIAFADMKILATLYEQLKALHHYEQDT